MSNTVYIGLGSNLGNRYFNIKDAIFRLNEKARILEISKIEETDPVGFLDQPKFLNCVLKIDTALKIRELFDFVKGIEGDMGRKISIEKGPRIIDLDILFFNRDIIDEIDLKVPHPHIASRFFVLRPLNELSPELSHPVTGKTVRELLKALGN